MSSSGVPVGNFAKNLRQESAEFIAPRPPVHAAQLAATLGVAPPLLRTDDCFPGRRVADPDDPLGRLLRRLHASAWPMVYHLAVVVICCHHLCLEYLVLHNQGRCEEILAYDLLRVAPAVKAAATATAGGGRQFAAVAVEEAVVVQPGPGSNRGHRMIIAGGMRRSCHCQWILFIVELF